MVLVSRFSSCAMSIYSPCLSIAATILSILAGGTILTFPVFKTYVQDNGSVLEFRAFPSTTTDLISIVSLGSANLLSLKFALWTHSGASSAADALNTLFPQSVSAHVGQVPIILSWIACALVTPVLAYRVKETYDKLIPLKESSNDGEDTSQM